MRRLSIESDEERLAHYQKLSQSVADVVASADGPDVKTCKLLEQIASQLIDMSLTVDHIWLGLNSLHQSIEDMGGALCRENRKRGNRRKSK